MGRRRQGREFALQSLYLTDVSGMSGSEAAKTVGSGSKLDASVREFADSLIKGTETHRHSLDSHIRGVAKNWELGRMASVDRTLLRLSSFELIHCVDTPVSVVIDEALEIAKVYSSHDSSKFINGILDKIKLERKKPAKNKGGGKRG
ncbi:MAG: transcription antitermination factor NusB [Elusimicrobia bacterium]|nr:MAG: transcription antitermination factor NusB [Elusimicrobiota bacterium]